LREVLDNPIYRETAAHIAEAIAEETAEDRVVAEIESLIYEKTLVSP
jgi:UDP:flavonoid glycosyltransferase YjiC (YdhE family)